MVWPCHSFAQQAVGEYGQNSYEFVLGYSYNAHGVIQGKRYYAMCYNHVENVRHTCCSLTLSISSCKRALSQVVNIVSMPLGGLGSPCKYHGRFPWYLEHFHGACDWLIHDA